MPLIIWRQLYFDTVPCIPRARAMEIREGGIAAVVQRRMGRAGTSLVIARAAWNPSITGMKRSRIRMSGISCRIFLTPNMVFYQFVQPRSHGLTVIGN